MASIYDANTNYSINGIDLRANPGLVTREYLIDVYPTLIDTFRFAGLWTWGFNGRGELGDNTIIHRSSPVQTVSGGANWKQVSAGNFFSAAIKTDGTLWLWGDNTYANLGDNTVIHRSSPVQTIAGGTNWKQVSAADGFTSAIKTDGTLWLWGINDWGQIGDNTTTRRSSPVQTISNVTTWKQVSCSGRHTTAIKTDGTLWTWGNNDNGQLGDNTVTHRSSPVQTVAGGTNWKQVSVGAYYTAGIKNDGTLWLWGYNPYGNLGDNTTISKSSPIQTTSGGTNWKQVSCGGYHTSAIKTDGTLWTWGYNVFAQLGDNTTISKSSPIQTVAGGTNWKQVSSSVTGYNTSAIKTDGTLWAWGYNLYGALGDNTVTTRSSPVQTVSGGTNWKQVSSDIYHTMAIRDNSEDPIIAPIPVVSTINIEYLVVAGGGAGGHGGGGAGGYRSSVSGESSGGGASAEAPLTVSPGASYTVTIGAGGTGGSTGTSGSNSVFSTVTSVGGGRGAGYSVGVWYTPSVGGSGGGGGRDPGYQTAAAGTANQGRAGGNGVTSPTNQAGGGGGASDAGEAGATDASFDGGDGGNGVSSSVTGSAVTRGGGGGAYAAGGTAGTGGTGGGGAGGTSFNGTSGTVNTGGGGGGADVTGNGGSIRNGGNGGSGIVILRYPSSYTITLSAGLTGTTSTVGANKVTTITAGTGTVSWS